MICLACRRSTGGRLCRDCREELRPAPDRSLEGGLRVRSAYLHRGAARSLVHNLKYRGVPEAGHLLAEAMADLIPPLSTLIPVPRVGWRKLKHGIDPAVVLATRLAQLTGGRRQDLLVPPLFGASQAKASRDHRKPPIFRAMGVPVGPVVLVDDVVTTGGTVLSAWDTLGFTLALVVSATSVDGSLNAGGRVPGREIRG